MSTLPTPPNNGLIPTAETFWTMLLGPNYKVRRMAILNSANRAAFVLSMAPVVLSYSGVDLSFLPLWFTKYFFCICGGAEVVIKWKTGFLTKQNDVSGGNVIQSPAGSLLGQKIS